MRCYASILASTGDSQTTGAKGRGERPGRHPVPSFKRPLSGACVKGPLGRLRHFSQRPLYPQQGLSVGSDLLILPTRSGYSLELKGAIQ